MQNIFLSYPPGLSRIHYVQVLAELEQCPLPTNDSLTVMEYYHRWHYPWYQYHRQLPYNQANDPFWYINYE